MGWLAWLVGLGGYVVWARWFVDRPVVVAYHTVWSPLLRRLLGPRFVAITLWSRILLLRVDVRLSVQGKAHELIHVRQWRRYPATFPLRYLWASGVAAARGGDAYRDNAFEVEAREGAISVA